MLKAPDKQWVTACDAEYRQGAEEWRRRFGDYPPLSSLEELIEAMVRAGIPVDRIDTIPLGEAGAIIRGHLQRVRDYLAIAVPNVQASPAAVEGDLLEAAQFSDRWGINADRLRKARERGALIGTRRGRFWHYRLAEVRNLWPSDFATV